MHWHTLQSSFSTLFTFSTSSSFSTLFTLSTFSICSSFLHFLHFLHFLQASTEVPQIRLLKLTASTKIHFHSAPNKHFQLIRRRAPWYWRIHRENWSIVHRHSFKWALAWLASFPRCYLQLVAIQDTDNSDNSTILNSTGCNPTLLQDRDINSTLLNPRYGQLWQLYSTQSKTEISTLLKRTLSSPTDETKMISQWAGNRRIQGHG